jgi:hypothetical protein
MNWARRNRIDQTFPSGSRLVALKTHVWQPILVVDAYFSPSWTALQADGGRDFNVIVDGASV